MIIPVEPLERAAFAQFGEVLETGGVEPLRINSGLTLKYPDLARIRLDPGSEAQLCLYRSDPVSLPFRLRRLERHPLASQAFIPLHPRAFPVVVAEAVRRPAPEQLRVFMSNGRQGVCLHPGTWHHHQLSLETVSDYLVIERLGESGNLEECTVRGEAVLAL